MPKYTNYSQERERREHSSDFGDAVVGTVLFGALIVGAYKLGRFVGAAKEALAIARVLM